MVQHAPSSLLFEAGWVEATIEELDIARHIIWILIPRLDMLYHDILLGVQGQHGVAREHRGVGQPGEPENIHLLPACEGDGAGCLVQDHVTSQGQLGGVADKEEVDGGGPAV